MLNNPDIPVFFEIEEIENYLKSFTSNDLKLDYLKELYSEFVEICYRYSDKQLNNYLKSKNLSKKYPPIPYYQNADRYQTHISRSKFNTFLRKIDKELFPHVRYEILKLDNSFKEDDSQIIKDYPVFNFNKEKIIEFSRTLKKDKLNYLKWIIIKREDYINEMLSQNTSLNRLKIIIKEDKLIKEVSGILDILGSIPEPISKDRKENKKTDKVVPKIFKNDKSLFEFNLNEIKENAKNKSDTNDAILYLLHVRKEAIQNKDIFLNNDLGISFVNNIEIEIDFYKEKQKIEDENISKHPSSEYTSLVPKKDPIRLHWQSDDVLIPYLMDQLFQEGFISNSDNEIIRSFIEQSFYKKSGRIFTAKEVSTVKSNYESNRKNNKKPRKSYKVERVIENLKSKRDGLNKKKTSRAKKK